MWRCLNRYICNNPGKDYTDPGEKFLLECAATGKDATMRYEILESSINYR